MIITIGGPPGSGKSTIAKMLSKHLGYERVYAGQVFRDTAKEYDMTMGKFANYLVDHQEIELAIDQKVKSQAEAADNAVYETRVGKALLPDSLSVFLDVSDEQAAKRILGVMQDGDTQRNEENYASLQEAMDSNRARKEVDTQRYKALYMMDIYDASLYDVVVDTSNLSVDEVFAAVVKGIEEYASPF